MTSQTKTSGYFNSLVSSISGNEFPLMLVTMKHATLQTPFRLVNDNQDITSNGDLYSGVSYALNLPNQPSEGLTGSTLTIANVGDKVIPDFIESVSGQGVTADIQIVLRSAPDDIEYQITLDVVQFSISKEVITARLSAPNYYQQGWSSVHFGAKFSPSLL